MDGISRGKAVYSLDGVLLGTVGTVGDRFLSIVGGSGPQLWIDVEDVFHAELNRVTLICNAARVRTRAS